MILSSPLVLNQESFALQGHLAVAGDIFGCHHLVDIKWDAGKYGTISRSVLLPTTKILSANLPIVPKPCSSLNSCHSSYTSLVISRLTMQLLKYSSEN